MATLSASNNGNGTAQVTSSGAADGCTWVGINNTSTGANIYTGGYNNSSLSVTDTQALAGSNSYTINYFTGAGGSLIGSLSASTSVSWPTPSASYSISGPNVACTWSVSDDNNSRYSFDLGQGYVNGVAHETGGLSGSTSYYFVGYSTSFTVQSLAHWKDSSGAGPTTFSSVNSGTTGPAPPAAPNPASNVLVTSDDDNNTVALAWTPSSGGATGYYVYRTQPGGSRTFVNSTTGTTYTDTAAGSGRPILYEILAYNSNSAGTTFASSYSSVYTKARVSLTSSEYWTTMMATAKANGILWLLKTIVTGISNYVWVVYNARLIPGAAISATGISIVPSNLDEDPNNDDGVWAVGTGAIDFRVPLSDPSSVHMSNPTGTQQFRILMRTP